MKLIKKFAVNATINVPLVIKRIPVNLVKMLLVELEDLVFVLMDILIMDHPLAKLACHNVKHVLVLVHAYLALIMLTEFYKIIYANAYLDFMKIIMFVQLANKNAKLVLMEILVILVWIIQIELELIVIVWLDISIIQELVNYV